MYNIQLILLLATSMLTVTTTHAAPADLPKSGQISCADSTGAVMACMGTGQDGDHQAGVVWPSPRFIGDETGNCITDTLTDLVWVRNPDVSVRNWQQALDFANNLALCGSDDWRLPNIVELESLVNLDVANQAGFLSSQGFSGMQTDNYWSSTIYAGCCSSTALAWVISMGHGDVVPVDRFGNGFVVAVRGRLATRD
ncbi:MAG: DUF1566 domain-containing protein [Gammaproteobacteria bacterium]|nr:DUF1566 domain-containing protein [Gammaproteobacteria bacterium]